jgi:hypothetical protein
MTEEEKQISPMPNEVSTEDAFKKSVEFLAKIKAKTRNLPNT